MEAKHFNLARKNAENIANQWINEANNLYRIMLGHLQISDRELRTLDCRIGTYVLGAQDCNGNFIPQYVGRSDSNLKDEIIQSTERLGFDALTHFKHIIANDAFEAFQKESLLCHALNPQIDLLNNIHPARPNGEQCSYCDQLTDQERQTLIKYTNIRFINSASEH